MELDRSRKMIYAKGHALIRFGAHSIKRRPGAGGRRLLPVLCLICALLLAACGGSSGQQGTAAPGSPSAPAGPSGAPAAQLPEPSGSDKSFTLMVYMIGSDLESLDGAASSDIREIQAALAAAGGKQVGGGAAGSNGGGAPDSSGSGGLRVLLQTGGASRWFTEGIAEDKIQRYEISGDGLKYLEDAEAAQMSDPACLHDYLAWGLETAPADRYGAILWDHGAGTILGYGFDEHYPDESLLLADLYKAFEGLDAHFDFIGFDACLMGTLETAMAFSPYADYLIASEEYEPSTGWFYTDWVGRLAVDTGS